ncbi:beta-ketoacyl-ACP synthase III [soil metagenome]
MTGATITGWGVALPETILGNDELAQRFGTTAAWIEERTGIVERRVGGTTAGLATDAGGAAIDAAGIRATDVDLLLLATTTPDRAMPATASVVQDALGTSGGAFDLNAACAGFVYALITGFGLIGIGARRTLVIGADVMTRLVDPADRATAVLFGDGAAAVVLEGVDGPGALLAWDTGSDGSAAPLLLAEHGGTTVMDGGEVFRRAVRVLVASSQAVLGRAGLGPEDVTLLVPHQANARIIEAARNHLCVPAERTAVSLARTGNTSAASVPLALAAAAGTDRLAYGDIVLLCGYGAGLTWASALLRWSR